MFVSDDEEEDWPDFSEDHKTKYIPPTPVNGGTDSSTQKRFAVRKKSDSVMYNMGVILAAVAAGFDIRISNTSAIHPNLHSVEEEKSMKKRDSFILNRRDAYLGAVRDSFIEPEGNFNNHNYSNASGFRHTYHGVQTRQRPSIQNFEVPMHFTEKDDSPGSQTSSTTGSKSSPQRLSYTESDSTVTSDRSSILQRQISDSSNYESTASSQAPQRRSVTFEDDFAPDYRDYKNTPTYTHKRTPSNTSNSSNTPQDYETTLVSAGRFVRSTANASAPKTYWGASTETHNAGGGSEDQAATSAPSEKIHQLCTIWRKRFSTLCCCIIP